MRSTNVWRLLLGVYWLSLGAWFGGLIMLAIAAAATFNTVRIYQPIVTAESYATGAEILAGAIVGRSIDALRIMQWICAAGLVPCLILQQSAFVGRLATGGLARWMNTLRLALIIVPLAILGADTWLISPRLKQHRQAMNAPAQSDAQAAMARASFDRYHHLSRRLLSMQVLMLGTAVLASAFALHDGQAATGSEEGRVANGG